MARRSVLFSPGDQPQKLSRAAESGADMIVFDLEDGVAPDRKQQARETVVDALGVDTTSEVCVRLNPVGMGGATDLAALADAPTPDSLMLPKVSTPDEIATVGHLGTEYGLDCPVVALIETAAGHTPSMAGCELIPWSGGLSSPPSVESHPSPPGCFCWPEAV